MVTTSVLHCSQSARLNRCISGENPPVMYRHIFFSLVFARQGTVIQWVVCEEGVEVRGVGQSMMMQLGSNWSKAHAG